jgi:hypothetical protein
MMLKKLLRLVNGSSAQALPLTLVALALGALLVSPFLVNASVNLLSSRQVDASIKDYYSADAGVEWALWCLKNDPTLTAPLPPTPVAVNGFSFPVTQISYVPNAGMAESVTPAWQAGAGAKCYPFTSSDAGSILAMVEVAPSQVWIALLSDSDPCQTPVGLDPVGEGPPYAVQFSDMPAGAYQLLVEMVPPGTGTVTISYPVASYDISSEMNGRSVTSRATASENAVRIISWQLEQQP